MTKLIRGQKGSGLFPRVGSGPAAWSESHGDNEPDPISTAATAALFVGAAGAATGDGIEVRLGCGGMGLVLTAAFDPKRSLAK